MILTYYAMPTTAEPSVVSVALIRKGFVPQITQEGSNRVFVLGDIAASFEEGIPSKKYSETFAYRVPNPKITITFGDPETYKSLGQERPKGNLMRRSEIVAANVFEDLSSKRYLAHLCKARVIRSGTAVKSINLTTLMHNLTQQA